MICSLSVHRLFHKLRILVCAALFALLGSANLWAQTRPKILGVGIERPASAIYIGNSFFFYNNGLSGHVTRLLAAADPQYKFRSTSVTISGSGFDWHDVDSYFRPNAVGSYSFDAKNNIVFNKSTGCLISYHDGLQSVPCSSAVEKGVLGVREETQRHGPSTWHHAGVFHVLGLRRRAGNDGPARRAIHPSCK